MSKLREAEEELFRAWRGSSLSEMIAAVHAMDDALEEDRLTAAVLAEREACAMEAENEYRDWPPFCGIDGGEIVANDIAKAIRARGKE